MAGKKKTKNDRQKKDSGKKDGGQVRAAKVVESTAPVAKAVAVAKVVEPIADNVAEVVVPSAESARRGALTEMVPVRFDKQMLADVRERAADDHRSVSSWIRRAVDVELQRGS